jgi:hypothetical protein
MNELRYQVSVGLVREHGGVIALAVKFDQSQDPALQRALNLLCELLAHLGQSHHPEGGPLLVDLLDEHSPLQIVEDVLDTLHDDAELEPEVPKIEKEFVVA